MSATRRDFFKMLSGAAVAAVVPVPPEPEVVYQIGLDLAQAGTVADFARYVLIIPGGGLVMLSEGGVSHD